ncbi:MAG: hypothetical protein NVS3B10_06260 [Polyangiales bacterium]
MGSKAYGTRLGAASRRDSSTQGVENVALDRGQGTSIPNGSVQRPSHFPLFGHPGARQVRVPSDKWQSDGDASEVSSIAPSEAGG